MRLKKGLLGRITVVLLLSGLLCLHVSAQEGILTASEYFDKVSEIFGSINDYEGQISISFNDTVQSGTIFYKSPNLLRIDFDVPETQVICINNEMMQVYLPDYRVILQQEFTPRSSTTLATMAASQGLHILRNNYKVSYLEGPNPIPLDEENQDSEEVIKLKFTWRDIKEGFKELIISFTTDGYIRRMKGTQAITNKVFIMDYYDIRYNQGIPDNKFLFDDPPYANVYDNFLFGDN